MKFNHTLKTISVHYDSQTGSRNRVRIPVAGTGFCSIGSAETVSVSREGKKVVIRKSKKQGRGKGLYTVEQDGAIRIPAKKFGLKSSGIKIVCDCQTNQIYVQ